MGANPSRGQHILLRGVRLHLPHPISATGKKPRMCHMALIIFTDNDAIRFSVYYLEVGGGYAWVFVVHFPKNNYIMSRPTHCIQVEIVPIQSQPPYIHGIYKSHTTSI